MRFALLTLAALVAFAANSILCRLALADGSIDPATFTLVRIGSGAIVLWVIVLLGKRHSLSSGNWLSAGMLFAYAIFFSLAYVGLAAGTGALLLFGSVQATMLLASFFGGHRLGWRQSFGLAIALAGLGYLVAPGVSSPPLVEAHLMVLAGVAWGFYSLRGRGVTHPIGATAGNFVRAVPLAVACGLIMLAANHVSPRGIALAVGSGAITSGLGYVAWYAVLPALGATRAALLQLSVPVIAALGGVVFLGESLTTRIVLATVATLVGVGMAIKTSSSNQNASRPASET